MKEKLVEEWLIRARERGGIDHAFGQWLISQGHEILWLGHSRTEFGKDIISISPDGRFHAYQMKDEEIDLKELRSIRDQINELIEVPPVHPRIPHGSSHLAHLVTSALFKEEATLQIRALNEGWAARGKPILEIIGRDGLIPRFVGMSDAFWPEQPSDIRDFFSFYLAEGRGDFDPEKFSAVLHGLLSLSNEPPRRKAQRLAAVGLLGNYLLNPFEREGDHWSLFRGWTMVAAHQAWFAEREFLPDKDWKPSFKLAKDAARESLIALSTECLAPNGFMPQDNEMDDYTRARNLVLAGALSAVGLIAPEKRTEVREQMQHKIEMLLLKDRLFAWGESAVPHLLAIQWYAEREGLRVSALAGIESVISTLCERNHIRSEDEYFPPPLVSADDALSQLFTSDLTTNVNRRVPGTWSLETLVEFFARRQLRIPLERAWRNLSRLDMVSFQPEPATDGLLWKSPRGHEAIRKPEMTQSWKVLTEKANEDRSKRLPNVLRKDLEFALMFLLTYPHRMSAGIVHLLDANYLKEARKDGVSL